MRCTTPRTAGRSGSPDWAWQRPTNLAPEDWRTLRSPKLRPLPRVPATPPLHRPPPRHATSDHASQPPTPRQKLLAGAGDRGQARAAAPSPGGSVARKPRKTRPFAGKAWHADQITVSAPPASLI